MSRDPTRVCLWGIESRSSPCVRVQTSGFLCKSSISAYLNNTSKYCVSLKTIWWGVVHFPQTSKSEPAARSKTRIESPAWRDYSRKFWIYNQNRAVGWISVISIVSSTVDQAAATKKLGGRRVSSMWAAHLLICMSKETGRTGIWVPTGSVWSPSLASLWTVNTCKTMFLIKTVLQRCENTSA